MAAEPSAVMAAAPGSPVWDEAQLLRMKLGINLQAAHRQGDRPASAIRLRPGEPGTREDAPAEGDTEDLDLDALPVRGPVWGEGVSPRNAGKEREGRALWQSPVRRAVTGSGLYSGPLERAGLPIVGPRGGGGACLESVTSGSAGTPTNQRKRIQRTVSQNEAGPTRGLHVDAVRASGGAELGRRIPRTRSQHVEGWVPGSHVDPDSENGSSRAQLGRRIPRTKSQHEVGPTRGLHLDAGMESSEAQLGCRVPRTRSQHGYSAHEEAAQDAWAHPSGFILGEDAGWAHVYAGPASLHGRDRQGLLDAMMGSAGGARIASSGALEQVPEPSGHGEASTKHQRKAQQGILPKAPMHKSGPVRPKPTAIEAGGEMIGSGVHRGRCAEDEGLRKAEGKARKSRSLKTRHAARPVESTEMLPSPPVVNHYHSLQSSASGKTTPKGQHKGKSGAHPTVLWEARAKAGPSCLQPLADGDIRASRFSADQFRIHHWSAKGTPERNAASRGSPGLCRPEVVKGAVEREDEKKGAGGSRQRRRRAEGELAVSSRARGQLASVGDGARSMPNVDGTAYLNLLQLMKEGGKEELQEGSQKELQYQRSIQLGRSTQEGAAGAAKTRTWWLPLLGRQWAKREPRLEIPGDAMSAFGMVHLAHLETQSMARVQASAPLKSPAARQSYVAWLGKGRQGGTPAVASGVETPLLVHSSSVAAGEDQRRPGADAAQLRSMSMQLGGSAKASRAGKAQQHSAKSMRGLTNDKSLRPARAPSGSPRTRPGSQAGFQPGTNSMPQLGASGCSRQEYLAWLLNPAAGDGALDGGDAPGTPQGGAEAAVVRKKLTGEVRAALETLADEELKSTYAFLRSSYLSGSRLEDEGGKAPPILTMRARSNVRRALAARRQALQVMEGGEGGSHGADGGDEARDVPQHRSRKAGVDRAAEERAMEQFLQDAMDEIERARKVEQSERDAHAAAAAAATATATAAGVLPDAHQTASCEEQDPDEAETARSGTVSHTDQEGSSEDEAAPAPTAFSSVLSQPSSPLPIIPRGHHKVPVAALLGVELEPAIATLPQGGLASLSDRLPEKLSPGGDSSSGSSSALPEQVIHDSSISTGTEGSSEASSAENRMRGVDTGVERIPSVLGSREQNGAGFSVGEKASLREGEAQLMEHSANANWTKTGSIKAGTKGPKPGAPGKTRKASSPKDMPPAQVVFGTMVSLVDASREAAEQASGRRGSTRPKRRGSQKPGVEEGATGGTGLLGCLMVPEALLERDSLALAPREQAVVKGLSIRPRGQRLARSKSPLHVSSERQLIPASNTVDRREFLWRSANWASFAARGAPTGMNTMAVADAKKALQRSRREKLLIIHGKNSSIGATAWEAVSAHGRVENF